MPPDHGAAIVHEILGNDAQRTAWLDEVGAMRARMAGLRSQYGMFSLLGIDLAQVHAMRAAHHVYMLDDSRINIAGLSAGNLAYVAHAVAQVLRESV